MRRGFGISLALSLALLFGCGANTAVFAPGDVIWGQVSALNNNTIELDLGSLIQEQFEPSGETASINASNATVVSEAGEPLSLDDVVSDDVVRITMGQDGAQEVMVSRTPEAIAAEQGEAQTVVSEADTRVGESLSTSAANTSALRIEGNDHTFVDCLISKNGDTTDATKSRLFGLNAAVLLRQGSHAIFDGGKVTTGGTGASGIYCYGGAATLNKTQITTTKDDAPGVVATASGKVDANGASITTSGINAPALRISADGTANIASGEYVTNGYDSPVVEGSGALNAEGVKATAAHSETIAITGSAQAKFVNCSLAGDMDENRGTRAALGTHAILICQEDLRTETPTEFSVEGGSLTNNAGDLFFVTNTQAHVRLQKVTVQNASPDAALMRVSANDGKMGLGNADGSAGNVTLTCVEQTLTGNLIADADSSLTVELTQGSKLTGQVMSEAGVNDNGEVNVVVEAGSTWHLTKDSTITTLENHGTIVFDGHKLKLADGSVLGG